MTQKVPEGYACKICEEVYNTPAKAISCESSHQIIYVPMTITELNRLINGIFLADLSIIPESLLDTLRKIQKARLKDGISSKM